MCAFKQKQKGKQLIFWLKSQPKKNGKRCRGHTLLSINLLLSVIIFLSSCYWQIMPKKVGVKTSFLWNTLPRDIMTALWGERAIFVELSKECFLFGNRMKTVNHGVNFLGLLCCAVLAPGSNHFPGVVVPGSNAFASPDDTNLFLLPFFFSGFFYFVCIFMSSCKKVK